MTTPLDTARVRVELDSRGAERDARRAGERAGRAFAKAAEKAAGRINIEFDINERKLQRQLRQIDAKITATVELDDDKLQDRIRHIERDDIEIPVRFELRNDTEIAARIRQLEANEITIPALVELADEQARTQLSALEARRLTIGADIDLDRIGFDARIAALGTPPITIPANVDVDDAQLDALRARIEATNPTIDVDVRVQDIPPVIVRARVVVSEEQLNTAVERAGTARVNVNEGHIAAQVAAGIKAGEALAGDIEPRVNTNVTGRLFFDRFRTQALTRALPPVRLRAVIGNVTAPRLRQVRVPLDADPAALHAQIQAYFTGNPVNVRVDSRGGLDDALTEVINDPDRTVRIRYDTDRGRLARTLQEEVDQASRKLRGTLVNNLGPEGTLPLDLELEDGAWAEIRAEIAAHRDITVPVQLDVDDVAARRAFDRFYNADGSARDRAVEVDVEPSWPPRADSGARADYEAWAGSLPAAEVEVEVDGPSLATARGRIENTLNDLAASVELDVRDEALRARLRELESGVQIPVGFRIRDAALNARLNSLRRGVEVPVRLDLDPSRVAAQIASLPGGSVEVAARLDLAPGELAALEARVEAVRPRVRVDLDTDALRDLDVRVDGDVTALRAAIAGVDAAVDVALRADTAAFRAVVEALGPYAVAARLDLSTAEARGRIAVLGPYDIPARLDLDTAAARAAVEALGPFTIPLRLDIATGALAEIRARIANIRPTIMLRLDILPGQIALLRTRILAIRPTIQARLDADIAALRARLAAISDIRIEANVDVNEAAIAARVAAAVRAGSVLGSVGGGAGGGGGGAAAGGLGGIAGILGPLAQAGALAAGLAVAGAGIAAAWGAASTAIAAVPGAIALIAGPLAAVIIGMEGIKRAAATLKPEFDRLRASVENTLERGFTRAFETLRPLIPQLEIGLTQIAFRVGETAQAFATLLTQGQNVGLLRQVFDNISGSISNMQPGLLAITEGFLQVAAQSGAFDAITEAVNRFGDAFQASVTDLISDGRMQQAFSGLGDVLGELSEGFVSLVENGIRTFAAAAPGITSFLDDLTGFFDRFDFNVLGEAVGSVFEGLGQALEGVPTATFREIEDSFTNLGNVFKSQSFQADLQTMIGGIPAAIDTISDLTTAFGNIGAGLSEGLQAFQTVDDKFQNFQKGLNDVADSLAGGGGAFNLAESPLGRWLQDADHQLDLFFGTAPGKVSSGMTNIGGAAAEGGAAVGEQGAAGLQDGFGTMEGAIEAGGVGVIDATGTALAPIPETTRAILSQISPIIENSFAGLSVYAAIGMNRVAQAVQASGPVIANALRVGLLGLDQVILPALTAINAQIIFYTSLWAVSLTAGMTALATGATAGLAAVQVAVAAGLTTVNSTIIAAVAVWALSVTFGMQSIAIAATTGFLGVQLAALTGMTLVNSTILAGTAVWALTVTFGMQAVALAATTGWTLVALSATTGLTLVNAAILAGVAVWGLSMTFGMQTVSLAVTTGFLNLGVSVSAGMASVNALIIAGAAIWALSIQLGIQNIGLAINTGFVTIGVAVTTGMAVGNAAIVAGMALWAATVISQMAVIVSAVQVGTAQMTLATSLGMSAMQAAFVNAMVAINSQVIAGMSSVRASVQIGVAGAVAAAQSSVGQFQAAGSNMGAALAAGLRSQLGAVQAAAAALANAAAAGLRAAAQIRSPSRVFMRLADLIVEGLLIRFDAGEVLAGRAGARLSEAAAAAVDKASQIRDAGIAAERAMAKLDTGSAARLETSRTTLSQIALEPQRDTSTADAVTELRDAVVGLVTALTRSGAAGEVVADEVRAQTRELVSALREVPPTSAAGRREMADLGGWR